MNSGAPIIPGGGALLPPRPVWLPPLDFCWIYTILVVFAAAQADRIRSIRVLSNPVGFFALLLVALAFYTQACVPAAFATLFFVLMLWAANIVHSAEGFMDATPTLDWVTNSRRWFVERVFKERPVAIQERDVATYPIAGASAQAGTQAGTT